ncbi:MAG: hypothetical protein AAFR14_13235, partial [Bacteroidota bacterium]
VFTFDNADIESVRMDGNQESNIYTYTLGMDISRYYLEGYEWRITERPTKGSFARIMDSTPQLQPYDE